MKQPWVYILASKRNGTLYVGVTEDVAHRSDTVSGFTKRYGVKHHVPVEFHATMVARYVPVVK